jgi:RNA polymerase sigma-70 factor (ECF subfamily)
MQAHEGAAASEISEHRRLTNLARQGSAAAFREIMQQNNRRLYRAIRSVLRDEAAAEMAMQDAYLYAFAHLHALPGDASLPTWLTRIALNRAMMRLNHPREAGGGADAGVCVAALLPIGLSEMGGPIIVPGRCPDG